MNAPLSRRTALQAVSATVLAMRPVQRFHRHSRSRGREQLRFHTAHVSSAGRSADQHQLQGARAYRPRRRVADTRHLPAPVGGDQRHHRLRQGLQHLDGVLRLPWFGAVGSDLPQGRSDQGESAAGRAGDHARTPGRHPPVHPRRAARHRRSDQRRDLRLPARHHQPHRPAPALRRRPRRDLLRPRRPHGHRQRPHRAQWQNRLPCRWRRPHRPGLLQRRREGRSHRPRHAPHAAPAGSSARAAGTSACRTSSS